MNKEKLTDDALLSYLKGSREKQNRAMTQLWCDKKVVGSLHNFVRQYRLKEEDHNDILQEALIILLLKIRQGEFQERSQVTTYLIGILKGICQNQNRKTQKVVDMEAKDILKNKISESPEVQLIELESKNEFAATMRYLFKKLSDKCQEVLRMKKNGYSDKEIATTLEWSNIQTAKNKVLICRKRFRELSENDPKIMSIIKRNT